MITPRAERMWRAGFATLNPVRLVDRLLDQIEQLGAALLPIQADGFACERIRFDPRID